MHDMSGPVSLTVAKGKPLLFVTPMLIRPTSYPRYEREEGGYRVPFTNITSSNLDFFVERPEVVPFDMGGVAPRGAWADHFFTVLRDGGRFRMWYEVMDARVKHDTGSHLRYAESDDGVAWTSPRLRLPRSTTHGAANRVYPVAGHKSHGLTVFRDPSDSRRPYKLIGYGQSPEGEDRIEGARSADGLLWEALDEPLVRRYMSDTQSVAAWDPGLGKYVGYFRYTYLDRRGIGYAETGDFEDWPRPKPLLMSSSLQEDIYTNGYTVYPNNPDLRFLFPAIYKKNPDTFELAAWASVGENVWARVGSESFLKPEDVTGEADVLVNAGVGLTPMPDGRIGLPVGYTHTVHNAVKSMHNRRPKAGYYWAVWERDRLGGVRCEGEGGFNTVRLDAPSGELVLNFRTRLSGEVRVQVRDESWNVLPGFAFEDCRLLHGDHAEATVSWARKRRLPSRPIVSLQFYLRNASLYGVTLR